MEISEANKTQSINSWIIAIIMVSFIYNIFIFIKYRGLNTSFDMDFI